MATEARSLTHKARDAVSGIGTAARVCAETLRHPDLRRVELAFVGFNMAEWAAFIAIGVYAFQQGGAEAVGLVAVIQLVPAAVFAPFAALLGDRYRREAMLLVAYVVQVATVGATAAALLLEAPVPLAYGLAGLAATGITLVRPVHTALLPALTRSPDQLTAAYVADGMIGNASVVVGPALAGAIMAISSPGAVYATLAGMLVLSCLFVARIRTRTERGAKPDGDARLLHEALAGFELVRRDRRTRLVIGLLGSELFVLGILDVLMVALAFEVFDSGESGTGFLNAAVGVGGLIGSAATVALIARRRLSGPMRAGMLVYGIPIALIAAAPAPGLALPALAAAGAGFTVMDVTGRMMLQRLVPDETLARAFGVLEGAYMAAEGIGAVLGAVLVVSLGLEWTLVACGLLVPALVLAARSRLAEADVGIVADPEHVRLLRSLPLFAALGPRELEQLAQRLQPVEVAAGEVVIAEGEPGDRFYVIERGDAEVSRDGRPIRIAGAGDYVGEIALLRSVPRTATITARTPMALLALERAPFLEAVTRYAPGVRAAEEIAEARMAMLPADLPDRPATST